MAKADPSRMFPIHSEKGRRKMEAIFLRSVEQGNTATLTFCLSNGVYPNIFDEDDLAAIHIVAIKGDMVVGNVLLEHPEINLNLRTPTGNTPLMLACIYQQRTFVRALLKKGANPNLINDKEQSALHMACTTGHTGIVTDLTAAGAEVNILDEFDNTPLSIAVTDHPSEAIARHLLKKGASSTAVKQFPLLLECVLNCDCTERLTLLKIILQYDADVNCPHPISKMNCLHYVGITGYLPVAEFLLVNGANLSHIDKSRRTPLQVAQDHKNKAVVKLFRSWAEKKQEYFSSTENVLQDLHKLYE